MKKIIVILLACVLVLSACGSADRAAELMSDSVDYMPAPQAEMDFWADDSFEMEEMALFSMAPSEMAVGAAQRNVAEYGGTIVTEPVEQPQRSVTETRRIIRNGQVEMETYEFDMAISLLRNIPESVGGYVENSSLGAERGRGDGRRLFNIVMRVPVEQFDAVITQIEGLATVTGSRQWAQDVTDQFYDTQTRLNTLLIEEDRILSLIDRAESLAEILDLEQRLSAVRLQMGRYQSSLNALIQQTTYSTINVTLRELLEEDEEDEYIPVPPPTFGDRLGGAFASSWGGTLAVLQVVAVLVVGAAVPLGLLGLLAWIGYRIYRRYRTA